MILLLRSPRARLLLFPTIGFSVNENGNRIQLGTGNTRVTGNQKEWSELEKYLHFGIGQHRADLQVRKNYSTTLITCQI